MSSLDLWPHDRSDGSLRLASTGVGRLVAFEPRRAPAASAPLGRS